WIFSGFPWFSLGYSQIDSPLVGIAPLLGVFGVSWAVALTAGLLAWAVAVPKHVFWALAGLVLLWSGSFGLTHIHWTHPDGDWQTVTLVQGDIDQQSKWTQAAIQQSIDRYMQLSHGHWDVNLVIWPETAIPQFYNAVKPALDNIGRSLKPQDTTLITGLIRANRETGHIYNSAVAVGAGH